MKKPTTIGFIPVSKNKKLTTKKEKEVKEETSEEKIEEE